MHPPRLTSGDVTIRNINRIWTSNFGPRNLHVCLCRRLLRTTVSIRLSYPVSLTADCRSRVTGFRLPDTDRIRLRDGIRSEPGERSEYSEVADGVQAMLTAYGEKSSVIHHHPRFSPPEARSPFADCGYRKLFPRSSSPRLQSIEPLPSPVP